MGRWYLALAVLALASCTTTRTRHVWSVREVVQNRQSLDGKTITIRGWLEDCRYLSCGLYDSAEEARRARDPDRIPLPGDEHGIGYYLSLGGYPWFDREAAEHACRRLRSQSRCGGIYVDLIARVDDRCMSDPVEGWIALCTDRPDTLVPIRIVRWSR